MYDIATHHVALHKGSHAFLFPHLNVSGYEILRVSVPLPAEPGLVCDGSGAVVTQARTLQLAIIR